MSASANRPFSREQRTTIVYGMVVTTCAFKVIVPRRVSAVAQSPAAIPSVAASRVVR